MHISKEVKEYFDLEKKQKGKEESGGVRASKDSSVSLLESGLEMGYNKSSFFGKIYYHKQIDILNKTTPD